MRWSFLLYLILCFQFLLFFFPDYSSPLKPFCNHEQSSALLDFKNSFALDSLASEDCAYLQVPSYPKTASWENDTDCCLWDGVTCDSMSGNVIGLDLSCSQLYGKFYPNNTLFKLTHLQTLNLAFNDFNLSRISPEFGGLVSLTHLNLSLSAFSGEIPSKISHLSKLTSLDLTWNGDVRLDQSIWKKFISNATNLAELVLDFVNMSSIKPDSLSLLSNLSSSLVSLGLEGTKLQGSLSNNVFCLPNLQELRLSSNWNLRVDLPNSNCSTSVRYLDLSGTKIPKQLPNSFGHLKSLNHLILHGCEIQEPIPPSFWNLTQLTHLGLGWNNFNVEILSLLSNFQQLTNLDLSRNNFKGQIPNSIGHLKHLKYLDLSENNFEGQIPNSIGHLKHLKYLDVSFCELQGSIPQTFWNLTQLTYLDLGSNELDGEISPLLLTLQNLIFLDLSDNKITGRIPDAFSQLGGLEASEISANNLTGPIQKNITEFSDLTELDLSNNLLSGTIPSWCFSSQSLLRLYLQSNLFTGDINDVSAYSLLELDLSENRLQNDISKSVFDLVNLTSLRLSSNNLSSVVNFQQFSKIRNLVSLDLSGNKFLSFDFDSNVTTTMLNLQSLSLSSCNVNYFPKFLTHLQGLRYLDLSNNNIRGRVPEWLNKVGNNSLSSLYLSHNYLSSVEHLSMVKLQYLDLSFNKFLSFSFVNNVTITLPNLVFLFLSSCNVNYFPKFLTYFLVLRYLDLSNNNICGRVPEWLNKVGNNSLSSLDLSHNCLSSVEHLSMMKLRFLDLSFNLLEGDIPIPPPDIHLFSVSNNKLTGHISSMICNVTFMYILNLSHNKLIGQIPQCLETLPDLLVLDLQMNNLFGTIPINFSKENLLMTLKFNHNQLEGPLPPSLAHCKQLEVLDLGHNRINDTFPNWLGPLKELQVLVLRFNKFHGMISNFQTKHLFPKLRIFDISNNYFNGPLPAIYMENFKGMMNIDDSAIGLEYMHIGADNAIGLEYMDIGAFSSYNDSVSITMKGVSEELTRILITFTAIDLSNNNFEGVIPKAIGELNSLIGLNLSHNKITGNIPPTLGDLKSLEWLDLSSNKLVGEIPKALANLNYLSFLNLSQNQLMGVIPRGRQFNTFSNDSYKGNPRLCGFPLSKACDDGEREQHLSSSVFHNEDEFGFGWKAVTVGYGCGFLLGVLMGYLVFTTGKPQWLVVLVEGGSKKSVRSRKSKHSPNRGRTN